MFKYIIVQLSFMNQLLPKKTLLSFIELALYDPLAPSEPFAALFYTDVRKPLFNDSISDIIVNVFYFLHLVCQFLVFFHLSSHFTLSDLPEE
jgi:hypothetical protein